MLRRAIVIKTAAEAEARLACFLSLLGIEWEALTAEALISRHGLEILAGSEIETCLIVCGEGLRALKSTLDENHIPVPMIGRAFAGSLFHSFDRSPALLHALGGFLSARIAAPKLGTGHLRYRVSKEYPDICGVLSGLSFDSLEKAADCGIEFELRHGVADTIISIDEASLLTRVRQESGQVFVASSPEILDLQEHTSTNVDFQACFSKVVPILVALRHLFRGSCWAPEVHYANIIIDDPPLWPRYGYVDLRELTALVDRTGCACTIAMIPWNYRRSNRRAVALVASRQSRLGVCVHGCNHTRAEFGSQDPERLTRMLLTARRRMDAHQQHTGLPYQPVMVFPQGVFSVEAMSCLNRGDYLAAVNTEVVDCFHQARVALRDLLNPAILCYDDFPLFTRRKPEAGTVNFAVDCFLGKPCLVVLHHDFFKGGIKNLEDLVRTFTAFHPQPTWDSLENIIKGCVLSKREVDGRKTIRIFANRALIRADQGQSAEMTVVKRALSNDKISRVEVDDHGVDFSLEKGFLKLNLEPRANRTISVNIMPAVRLTFQVTEEDSLREKTRVAVRRYLCEFRDTYSAKSETLLRCARNVARSLQRH
jgi:hypothetical protein